MWRRLLVFVDPNADQSPITLGAWSFLFRGALAPVVDFLYTFRFSCSIHFEPQNRIGQMLGLTDQTVQDVRCLLSARTGFNGDT